MNLFKKIVIDLGTVNSIYSVLGENEFYCEPSVVAVSVPSGKITAVGEQAKKMLGRTPLNIRAKKPLKDGVIADYKATETMMRHFIAKALGRLRLFKPELIIAVPVDLSSIEKSAVHDAAISAGARRVTLFPKPLAAAIGADVPIGEASGSMIINIGGGTTEAAVISLGAIVASKTFKVGGNKLDEAIAAYVKTTHGLYIGEQTAEQVKILLKDELEIKGRSVKTKAPATALIKKDEVYLAVKPIFEELARAVGEVLEKIPPELSSDVLDKGAVFSGGSALFKGLDLYLADYLSLPIHKVDNPLYCVAYGLKKIPPL